MQLLVDDNKVLILNKEVAKKQLAFNLRALCRLHKSASDVARQVGINRQQFEKYLQGRSYPSPNVLLRITKFFNISPEDILDEDKINTLIAKASPVLSERVSIFFPNSSQEELTRLRNYTGVYHVFFVTPAFPEYIHVGCALIREEENLINSHFFIKSKNPDTGVVHRTKLQGILMFRGERLILLERSKKLDDRFSETILLPSHGDRMKYISGLSLGLTWQPEGRPFASRTIWRRAQNYMGLCEAMRSCGLRPFNDPVVDPIVRKFFEKDNNLVAL